MTLFFTSRSILLLPACRVHLDCSCVVERTHRHLLRLAAWRLCKLTPHLCRDVCRDIAPLCVVACTRIVADCRIPRALRGVAR